MSQRCSRLSPCQCGSSPAVPCESLAKPSGSVSSMKACPSGESDEGQRYAELSGVLLGGSLMRTLQQHASKPSEPDCHAQNAFSLHVTSTPAAVPMTIHTCCLETPRPQTFARIGGQQTACTWFGSQLASANAATPHPKTCRERDTSARCSRGQRAASLTTTVPAQHPDRVVLRIAVSQRSESPFLVLGCIRQIDLL